MQGPSRLKKAPHLQENLTGQLSMSRRIRKELEDTKETKIKHSCGLWTHKSFVTTTRLQQNLHNSTLKVINQCSDIHMRVAQQSVREDLHHELAVMSCHDFSLISSTPNGRCI